MKTGPRIVMIIERFAPMVGGSETQCRLLAAALHASGVEVFVLTRRIESVMAPREVVDGVPVRRLPPTGLGRVWYELGFAMTVAAELIRRRKEYDIAHLHGGTTLYGAVVVVLTRMLGKRSAVKVATAGDIAKQRIETTAHGTGRPSFVHRAINRAINMGLRRADRMLCISKEIQDELRSAGFAASRVAMIPNAVDTERFQPVDDARRRALRAALGLPQEGFLLLFSGRLIQRKGVDVLLRAWAHYADRPPDATILLLGSGASSLDSTEAELRALAKEHGLDAHVRFLGEHPNALDYLQASDVFVFPSRREGLSNALLEAMSCGLPIVASAIGGTVDVMTHGHDGLLFPSEDAAALAGHLRAVLTDASLRATLGRHARETAVSQYGMAALLPRYRVLYATLHGS